MRRRKICSEEEEKEDFCASRREGIANTVFQRPRPSLPPSRWGRLLLSQHPLRQSVWLCRPRTVLRSHKEGNSLLPPPRAESRGLLLRRRRRLIIAHPRANCQVAFATSENPAGSALHSCPRIRDQSPKTRSGWTAIKAVNALKHVFCCGKGYSVPHPVCNGRSKVFVCGCEKFPHAVLPCPAWLLLLKICPHFPGSWCRFFPRRRRREWLQQPHPSSLPTRAQAHKMSGTAAASSV